MTAKEWLRENGATLAAGLAAAAALVSLALPASLPWRWAAAFALVLALPRLWRRFGPPALVRLDATAPPWRELAARFGPYLAVTAVALAALGPVALGRAPVSQDHANHYLHTAILAQDMLPSGRLFGWTDRLGIGYPFGDLHYTLCYLVNALPHLLSFGAIGLQASYAIGVCLAWIVSGLAVTALSRRLAGPFASAAAGILFVLDVGGDREGGWTYSLFHGVWPQQFGAGIWVFSLLGLWRLTEKADTRRLAAAALLVGLSLLVHPMNAVNTLVAAPLLIAVRLWSGRADGDPAASRGALRLLPALVAGGAIGSLWIVRMVLAGDSLHSIPVTWDQLPVLLGRALVGSPFDHEWAVIPVLALVGVIASIRLGGRLRTFLLLLAGSLLAIGAMDLVLGLDLGLLGGPFRTLQYRRFAVAIKPIWFALAAVGAGTVASGVAARLASAGARPRAASPALRVLIAAVSAPLLVGLGQALPGVVTSPAARPLTMENAKEAAHDEALRALAAGIESPLPVRRAVYWEQPGHGGRTPIFALADAGFGVVSTKFSPAQNFDDIAFTTDPAAMRALGVHLVVSRFPLDSELLEELAAPGPHRVFRFREPAPAIVEALGQGSVRVRSWSDERRVLELSGTAGPTTLRLASAPCRKWRATQGGRELPVAATRVGGVPAMEIRGAASGEIELIYTDTPAEQVAFALGALTLLACLAGLFLRPRPLPALSHERRALGYRALSWGLAAAVVAAAVALLLAGRAAVRAEWLAGQPAGTFLTAVLHREGPRSVAFEPEDFCVRPLSRDPAWGCSEAHLAPRLAPAPARDGRFPSCLSVGVPPGGTSRLVFGLPASATRIHGRVHAVAGAPAAGGALSFGGPETPTVLDPGGRFEARIPPGAAEAVFTLVNRGKQPARACLEAAALAD
jgi:hypothetical protein